MSITPNSEQPEQVLARSRTNTVQPGVLTFPRDIGPHGMLMIFRDYQYETPGNLGLLNYDNDTLPSMRLNGMAGVQLPMPANLRDTDTLRIERFEQGFFEGLLGGYVADVARGVQSTDMTLRDLPGFFQDAGARFSNMNMASIAQGALSNLISETLGQAASANVGSVARDAAYLLRSQLPNNLQRVSDAILGNTVNPKAALAFEGIELKQHNFNWNLVPKSAQDSDLLRSVIRTIKQRSLPTYQTLTGTTFKAYLQYPSVVDIYLIGVNREYFMKFKTSMIRSVTVDYSSSGLVSIVKGGKPAAVSLNIELMEMDIHTSNDYTGNSIESTQDSVGVTE